MTALGPTLHWRPDRHGSPMWTSCWTRLPTIAVTARIDTLMVMSDGSLPPDCRPLCGEDGVRHAPLSGPFGLGHR